MPEVIVDGTGNGYKAKVTADNRLYTQARASSIQHSNSESVQQAYQIIGIANLAASTVSVLHVKNTDSSRQLVVTYIRHQVIAATGGTSFPNVSNYFVVSLGRTRSSGGVAVTAVNVYGGSGNAAEIEAYQGATLTGTAQEIDRWYTQGDADMNVYNKEGSLIIPPNETMEIAYVGDHTGGIVMGRLSFIMEVI